MINCKTCGRLIEDNADRCLGCGAITDKGAYAPQQYAQPQQYAPPQYYAQRPKPNSMLFVLSLAFGIIGILINPLLLIWISLDIVDFACGLELISAVMGLLAFIIGIVIFKNDNRAIVSIILAIIIGILILIPILFVATFSFGNI